MTMFKKCLFPLIALLLFSGEGFSQTVTIGGTVRDTVTLSPIDSARIAIVNVNNSSERYTVFTNIAGVWSYTFQSNGVDEREELPLTVSLAQNYPNPFNPSTIIGFSIRRAGVATIKVHNILGQEIDTRSFSLTPGDYNIPWLSKGAAGALFYSIEMEGRRLTRKMIQLDGGGNAGLGNVTVTHGIATLPLASQRELAEYRVTASKLGYEPDSITISLTNNLNINFALQTVHRRAFLIDLHNDVMELAVNGYQLGVRHTTNHSDIPRFRDGGVDAQMFSIWPDPNQFPSTAYQRSMQMIDSFGVQLARNPATFAQARTSTEIQQANAAGKLAGILAVEGGHAIENDLNKLITLYQRGARYMTITWNNSTAWATSAADPQSATRGLSDFGRQVIRTMDSLGMIIDVSHVGRRTIEDILQVTIKPIIASHSGARALRDHYRNLRDDQIIAIAQRGGVIGVVFYPWFLSATGTATIDSVIRHIDYIKNLVGIDYVALGSDFDGIEVTPVGLEDVSRFPNLTMALLRRGYSASEVKKILGDNYMRVFRAVCQ
jgi:membrane dipeptidase